MINTLVTVRVFSIEKRANILIVLDQKRTTR